MAQTNMQLGCDEGRMNQLEPSNLACIVARLLCRRRGATTAGGEETE